MPPTAPAERPGSGWRRRRHDELDCPKRQECIRTKPMSGPQRGGRRRLVHRWTTGASATAVLAALLMSVGVVSVPPANANPLYVSDPASLVNTFIGTANGGDTFPGADVPFGMVQWSPDTVGRPDGGGYSYGDTAITGYALTHLSGPGCAGEGDGSILP